MPFREDKKKRICAITAMETDIIPTIRVMIDREKKHLLWLEIHARKVPDVNVSEKIEESKKQIRYLYGKYGQYNVYLDKLRQ